LDFPPRSGSPALLGELKASGVQQRLGMPRLCRFLRCLDRELAAGGRAAQNCVCFQRDHSSRTASFPPKVRESHTKGGGPRLCSGRVDTRTTALCVTGAFVRLPRLWRALGCRHGIRPRVLSDTAAMSRAGMTCSRNGRGQPRRSGARCAAVSAGYTQT
jgi:hypothetical protein